MELEKTSVRKCKEKGRAFSQITLEDDYIVPDTRADVVKVIHTRGTIAFDEPKISNQALWVNGRMNFLILYRSEDNEQKLEVLSGSIPFQEKLLIDGVDEQDMIRLSGKLEDISASIINSRKLSVRAVLDILAIAEREDEVALATGIRGEGSYEQSVSEQEVLSLRYNQKDILRVRKEIELPQSKPNISRILYDCVDVRNVTSQMTDDGILVQAEARVCVLYQGEGEEMIQCYETMLPIQGVVDGPAADAQDICRVEAIPFQTEIEAREDYDGELRMLEVEITFELLARVWKEAMVPILQDAYSLDAMLVPERSDEVMERLLIRNQAKLRLAEQFELDREQERILQVCCYNGSINIERETLKENGLLVEGVLTVHILYFTSDESLPVAHAESYLPIEQLIEIPAERGRIRYDLQTQVEQLTVNLLDSSSYEIKASLLLELFVCEEVELSNIRSLSTGPLDMERLQGMPGLTGYIVREGESLWDIAKAHHTTVERIMETNGLTDHNSQNGQKLIIVKSVS